MHRLALLAAAAWLVTAPALAQERHATTHALWVLGRFDPGAAVGVGYDLEIELGTPCGFNLGPSLSVALGGTDGGAGRQDVLGTLDLLRGRFLLDEEGCGSCGGYRLQALLGAGPYFVLNPASDPPPGPKQLGLPALLGSERYPESWRFGAQISAGLSADAWISRTFGITAVLVFRVRLDDYGRMPAIWAEAGLGARFGS